VRSTQLIEPYVPASIMAVLPLLRSLCLIRLYTLLTRSF